MYLPTRQAGHMADRRVWVEYSPSMMEPVRPGAVSPDRALCLPTFSHFVTVNKTSLSLSSPLSLSLSLSQSCVLQTGAEQVGQVYEKSRSSNVYRSTQNQVSRDPTPSFSFHRRAILLFITARPNTKLSAWGERDSGGHVL